MTHFDVPDAGIRSPAWVSDGLYARFGKRLLDILAVLISLPLLLPLIGLLILLARRDGGPGLYGHKRIGRHGRTFRCWKIRTMVPDAEQALRDHLNGSPEAALEWAKSFKLKQDPRVTPLGQFLRRTSLDELPQLWNILRADMSLVGPRPITVGELVFYGRDQHVYLRQRPGLTGMWQVYGRVDGCYSRRVHLDRQYLHKTGLAADISLILRTMPCVLTRTGR